MTWEDRIQEAAYTPKNENRLVFDFEDVSVEQELLGTAFNFPDANGTLIQRGATPSRTYPLRIFFSGANCDLQASEFLDSISNAGVGLLEHPMYGNIDAVPMGKIKRRDDLKTRANQVIIELIFWETIGVVYPSGSVDRASQIDSKLTEFSNSAAEEFSQNSNLELVEDQSQFKGPFKNRFNSAKETLDSIASTQAQIKQQFDEISESIDSGIDLLVKQPLTLAFQTIELIKTPGRIVDQVSARLQAFQNLAEQIIEDSPSTQERNLQSQNEFHGNNLFASTFAAGAALTAVNGTYSTRSEALDAATRIIQLSEDVISWRDESNKQFQLVDSGATHQKLKELIALTAGFLVEISFSLNQEYRLRLSRNRTLLDLSAELYGRVDLDTLTFLSNTNNLSWAEQIEIPKGREIVYYV